MEVQQPLPYQMESKIGSLKKKNHCVSLLMKFSCKYILWNVKLSNSTVGLVELNL